MVIFSENSHISVKCLGHFFLAEMINGIFTLCAFNPFALRKCKRVNLNYFHLYKFEGLISTVVSLYG